MSKPIKHLNQFTKQDILDQLPQIIAFVELQQSKVNPQLARQWTYLLCLIGSEFDGRKNNPFEYTIERLKPSLPNAPLVNVGTDTIVLNNGRAVFKFTDTSRMNVHIKETLKKFGFKFIFGSRAWEMKFDDLNLYYQLIHELNAACANPEYKPTEIRFK